VGWGVKGIATSETIPRYGDVRTTQGVRVPQRLATQRVEAAVPAKCMQAMRTLAAGKKMATWRRLWAAGPLLSNTPRTRRRSKRVEQTRWPQADADLSQRRPAVPGRQCTRSTATACPGFLEKARTLNPAHPRPSACKTCGLTLRRGRHRAAVPAGRPGRGLARTYHASRNDCAVQNLPPSEDLRPAAHCAGQKTSQVWGRQEACRALCRSEDQSGLGAPGGLQSTVPVRRPVRFGGARMGVEGAGSLRPMCMSGPTVTRILNMSSCKRDVACTSIYDGACRHAL